MKAKPKPKAEEIEELPDAWERFERAFDTVMRSPPKPMPAKKKPTPSRSPSGKRGAIKPA
jgi:hypothetical protein